MYACIHGHINIVNALAADSRVDLQTKDRKDKSGLMYACKFGNYEIVKQLLKNRTVLDHMNDSAIESNYSQGNALSIAASHGHTKIVEYLLSNPNFSLKTDSMTYRQTDDPVTCAVRSKKVETLKVLLDSPKINVSSVLYKYSYSLMRSASSVSNNVEVLDLLHKRKLDETSSKNDYMTPLGGAAYSGNIENVKYLLSLPTINPISGGKTYLTGNNRDNTSPIFLAIYNGKIDTAREMLKNEAVKLEFEDTIKGEPLLRACYLNDIESAKRILEDPACNVNVLDKNGYAALHVVTTIRDRRILKLLMNHPNTDINIRDCKGGTPLHSAVYHGTRAVIDTILSHPKINPNLQNTYQVSIH